MFIQSILKLVLKITLNLEYTEKIIAHTKSQ